MEFVVEISEATRFSATGVSDAEEIEPSPAYKLNKSKLKRQATARVRLALRTIMEMRISHPSKIKSPEKCLRQSALVSEA
jgi:hypothetical protein